MTLVRLVSEKFTLVNAVNTVLFDSPKASDIHTASSSRKRSSTPRGQGEGWKVGWHRWQGRRPEFRYPVTGG